MAVKFLILILISAFTVFIETETARKQISCEAIVNDVVSWPHVGVIRVCLMAKTTSIFMKDVQIAANPDESVTGLSFFENKKIRFPPFGVDTSFPNLEAYDFEYCSLESISRHAFKNLRKLKVLWLNNNELEQIPSDSFEDLTALEWLYLRKKILFFFLIWHKFWFRLDSNKIKFLNDQLFDNLIKLSSVQLEANDCIDENFNDTSQVAEMLQVINGRCGFTERDEFPDFTSCDSKYFQYQLQSKSAEINQSLIKIATLEAKLKAAEVAELKAESKVTLIMNIYKEIYEKLDAQRNEIDSTKAQQMRNEIEDNKREIAALKEKLVVSSSNFE